ncbi:hypothetical protein GJD58_28700, partial [Klebsiella pneumoniae]|uniref:hypothetical protein n=1 Tax=Klebsiella pneumoniae TaxID=573 RepID=UPI0012B94ECC
LEMRFKPMPQYREGALLTDGASKTSPVGKMFIQPQVTLESGDKAVRPDHGDGGVMQCKPAFEAVLRIAHPQRARGVILLA